MARQKILTGFVVIALLAGASRYAVSVGAEDNVDELKKQIEVLQKRVEELESAGQKQQGNEEDLLPFTRRSAPWDPFAEMERMQAEMNRMFQSSFGQSGLSRGVFSNDLSFGYNFDIQERDNQYEITFDMNGIDEKNLDIEIKDRSITVKGQYSQEQSRQNPDSVMSAKSFGSFLKTIPLPPDADTTRAKTEKSGNKLVITLPKK